MKKLKSAATALVLAAAALGTGMACAADVSQPAQSLSLAGGTGVFSHVITAGNTGNTFADRFNFTTTTAGDLAAQVSTISPGSLDGIKITGFSLFNSAGLSLGGTKVLQGMVDLWTLTTSHLVPDSYYLLVSGEVLTSAAASYAGTATVTAVPEPATYGMLLAGAVLVAYSVRRRNDQA